MVSIRGLSAAALLSWAAAVKAYCTSAQICGEVIPDSSSDDVYVQISAPVAAGWAGFGFGGQMRGALIFVIYSSADGKNVTLSPRIGKGNVEPKYDDSIKYEILDGTGIQDDKWVVNFVCHNCREWDGGSIDVESSEELFIFARGGDDLISSDERDASIYQHVARGNFPLDLSTATISVTGNPFTGNGTGNNGTDTETGNHNKNDPDTDPDTDNNNDDTTNNDDGTDTGNTPTGENGNDGNFAPMTKADKTLLAHGMAFIVASGFITSFFL